VAPGTEKHLHEFPSFILTTETTKRSGALETDIRRWTNERNKNPTPFVWTKSADEILENLAAYCR
jgi:hypothetical protein